MKGVRLSFHSLVMGVVQLTTQQTSTIKTAEGSWAETKLIGS